MAAEFVRMRHAQHGGVALVAQRAVRAHEVRGWSICPPDPEPPADEPTVAPSAPDSEPEPPSAPKRAVKKTKTLSPAGDQNQEE